MTMLPENERLYEVVLVSYDGMFDDGYSPAEYRVGYYQDYHEAVLALSDVEVTEDTQGYLKRRYPNGRTSVLLARYE